MAEPELLAIQGEIQEETPYFFQRIGELAFEAQQAGNDASKAAIKRQREYIATAPDHGIVAAAGENGTNLTAKCCFALLLTALMCFQRDPVSF